MRDFAYNLRSRLVPINPMSTEQTPNNSPPPLLEEAPENLGTQRAQKIEPTFKMDLFSATKSASSLVTNM